MRNIGNLVTPGEMQVGDIVQLYSRPAAEDRVGYYSDNTVSRIDETLVYLLRPYTQVVDGIVRVKAEEYGLSLKDNRRMWMLKSKEL
jgi:hypothetical protein